MSYEGMVNKLIEAGKIPKYKQQEGRRGEAEFDYQDPDAKEIGVGYFYKDYGLVATAVYTYKEIRRMYEEIKQSI